MNRDFRHPADPHIIGCMLDHPGAAPGFLAMAVGLPRELLVRRLWALAEAGLVETSGTSFAPRICAGADDTRFGVTDAGRSAVREWAEEMPEALRKRPGPFGYGR